MSTLVKACNEGRNTQFMHDVVRWRAHRSEVIKISLTNSRCVVKA